MANKMNLEFHIYFFYLDFKQILGSMARVKLMLGKQNGNFVGWD